MRCSFLTRAAAIGCLILATANAFGTVKLIVRDGRPIVDGVYVNGHGPYRFLIDTGANVNLIESSLARKIGMNATFQASLASAGDTISTPGSDGNEVWIDSVNHAAQVFLFTSLDAIHARSPDVRGVLGQRFLCQFDYALNLNTGVLDFGTQDRSGSRIAFRMVNARPVISTSLGDLALDSGQPKLLLFGAGSSNAPVYQLRTVTGTQFVGRASGKPLVISGRRISNGEAVAVPGHPEAGVDGLLPLALFRSVYVCNTEGYIVFE